MKNILKKSKLGITEDTASDILSSICLNVKFSQVGRKGSISLDRILPVNQKPSAILLGIDYANMTDQDKKEVEAYKISQRIRQNLVSYLPIRDIKDIEKIEQQNVRMFKRLCFGSNIMTEANYDQFKNWLKTQEIDKEVIVNKICSNWDQIMNNFIEDVSTKYPYIDKQEIIDVAKKKIGTAQGFKDSYRTVIEFMPIPNTAAVTFMPANLQQEAKDGVNTNAINEMEKSIGLTLNNLFDAFNKILISNNSISQLGGKGIVAPKTKGTVEEAINLAKQNLSFLQIDDVDNLLIEVKNLIDLKDDQKLVNEAEGVLYNIYEFLDNEDLLEYLDISNSVIPESLLKLGNTIITAADLDKAKATTINSNTDEDVYW